MIRHLCMFVAAHLGALLAGGASGVTVFYSLHGLGAPAAACWAADIVATVLVTFPASLLAAGGLRGR